MNEIDVYLGLIDYPHDTEHSGQVTETEIVGAYATLSEAQKAVKVSLLFADAWEHPEGYVLRFYKGKRIKYGLEY